MVLSACSSYFQSLFLDHPSRHPIVILKDVRYAELKILIEFMYKGEVNVQYCQLSALLKTAESLKVSCLYFIILLQFLIIYVLQVKGLAEMTNQNTALREPEREQERLRPATNSASSRPQSDSLDATTPKRIEPERCSPSPTRLQTSPTPLALYHRKSNREYSAEPPEITNHDHHHHSSPDNDSIADDCRSPTPEDDAMSNDVGMFYTIASYF